MKFKKQISLLLAVVMTFGAVNIAFADTYNNIPNVSYIPEEEHIIPMFKEDGDIAYPVEGGNIYFNKSTGAITAADNSITSANIPSTIDGVAVTSIQFFVFSGSSLTSITIPDSITTIDDMAILGCQSLKSITVSKENANYADIDGVLFNKNFSEIVRYPQGKQDKQYTIPDSVTSIGNNAFQCGVESNSTLTSVSIPDSVTSIGDYAFEYCSSLTNITIPDSVTSIGIYAFLGCTSLTNMVIPKGITYIEGLFSACSSLTNVTIPDGVTSIGGYTFNSCRSLKSITIPDSVTYIGDSAFEFCYSLANSLIIPDGVTFIGEYAFSYCSPLKSVSIPDSVTFIGWDAFSGDEYLKDVYYGGNEEQWNAIHDEGSGLKSDYFEVNMHYNSVILPTEGTTGSNTSATKVSVEGGNIYIGIDNGEVVDCDEGVISATIPAKINGVTVKSINANSFKNCKDLKSITIPETITSIPENTFNDCISLIEIQCTKGSFADNRAFYPENIEIKYTEAITYGDADGDGSLIASDAAAVLQKVLKSTYKLPIEDLTPDYEKYLDVDGSGKLDAADAAMILQKVLKSTYKFSMEN